jgi:predicted nucleic-acid-binding Zn-ribbon protein
VRCLGCVRCRLRALIASVRAVTATACSKLLTAQNLPLHNRRVYEAFALGLLGQSGLDCFKCRDDEYVPTHLDDVGR